MDTETQCLNSVKEAIILTEKIFAALSAGDSELAESHTKARQHILESIPFSELDETLPKDLQFAFNHLLTLNERLTDTSRDIRNTIAAELNSIKKGISNTQTYQDINHIL